MCLNRSALHRSQNRHFAELHVLCPIPVGITVSCIVAFRRCNDIVNRICPRLTMPAASFCQIRTHERVAMRRKTIWCLMHTAVVAILLDNAQLADVRNLVANFFLDFSLCHLSKLASSQSHPWVVWPWTSFRDYRHTWTGYSSSYLNGGQTR